jgi:nucleoside-diphosphate-sugar epimerase
MGSHRDKGSSTNWRFVMKVVVIGGTGLIGSKVVAKLNQHGHQAIAAAPNTGVNTLTGEGVADVLTGAQVVVDVANSPSFPTRFGDWLIDNPPAPAR